MKKTLIIIFAIITLFLLTSCVAPVLSDEVDAVFEVTEATPIPAPKLPADLTQSFEQAGFFMVAGQYSRRTESEEAIITELFVLEKKNFVQVATTDIEQEVFAYNYVSDDFTYLYYFDGTLMAKTKINLETGAVLEDDAEYADLLWADAENLKQYFYDVLQDADLTVQDIIN